MNKYLLLRDNKQSGPYSVPELIARGIKPYDLVWLEGKSAAWRYPSEVEELKAYAPVVEEQPFDRFYKKPQAQEQKVDVDAKKQTELSIKQERLAETHARYQPKPVKDDDASAPNKKVYVNFPNENSKSTANTSPVAQEKSYATVPSATVNERFAVKTEEEFALPKNELSTTTGYSDHIAHSSIPVVKKSGNNRLFQMALAACLLFGLLSGVLLFNHFRQRQELKDLNAMVQQIETAQKQQRAMNASLVQTEASSPASTVPPDAQKETIPTPPAEVDHKSEIAVKPPTRHVKKTPVEEEEPETAVVFSEKRPVERRIDSKTGEAAPVEETKENLFNQVVLKTNDYKTGLLGGISNLKFELTNNSKVELQRVAIEIKYLGPEKKVVKKHTVYFENVAPGSNSTIDVPKSNRGVSIEYVITDIKS